MYSAELAEVTAMKIKSSVAAAPPLPNIATYWIGQLRERGELVDFPSERKSIWYEQAHAIRTAASGRTKPAETSASAILCGNVGNDGLDSTLTC